MTLRQLIIFIAITFLFAHAMVESASAHLATKSGTRTLAAIHKSQHANLNHARYVCRHGARANQRWHCGAVKWLTRELAETHAKLAPREYVAPYPWQQIATCESSLGTGSPKWHINTGNGFYGGLQFDYGTWHEAQRNLGVYWTAYAHQATPAQQVRAAMTLPLTRWPVCGAPYR